MESLTPETRRLLGGLASRASSADFYLAGSAALALYLGHRLVRDLDLMSNTNRLAPQDRRDLLESLLEHERQPKVETARDGYLALRYPGEIALRFYYYPYPLVEPLVEPPSDPITALIPGPSGEQQLAVASATDLGLMKLAAIVSRGGRRDFVDLYLLCRELPLARLMDRAAEKFGHVADFPLQALKGLADTGAAAGEPMPALSRDLAWGEVERWVTGEVDAAGRELLRAP